ncbi:biotin synthase [Thermococcus sp. P6]|uniref:radical SAM protein n=1 Tax=Thermococcus sp. P6 TaxID=122420 RepID=UPI000B59F68A|nr:radical SAM protein [Thermococcus sp. P6]ASJ10462.1 biotin synthase [Thermococcus sp. P6]
MKVRVSYGTAIAMGLVRGRMMVKPTTAYLMTHHNGRCRNNCAFCPQARESRADLRRLSRVTWPSFEVDEVVEALPSGRFARICLQTVDYPGLVDDVFELLEAFQPLGIPVSLSITPVERRILEEFKSRNVDYIGVGLDVASERLYPLIKDSLYSWEDMWRFTRDVVEVFGEGRAFVHLIIGLGETDREAVETIWRAYSTGAEVSLFAFTPVKGTRLENRKPPDVLRYRRIQVAHHLIREGFSPDDFEFEGDDLVGFGMGVEELAPLIPPGTFATYGCPGCNRPYYNERPSKEPYNFPRSPGRGYVMEVLSTLLGSRGSH